MPNLVLDTNIILLDANNIITLGANGNVVILPETVVDELDSKKNGTSEIAYQARSFGRLIARATELPIENKAGMIIAPLEVDDIRIKIVSLDKYDIPQDVDPKNLNDRRIIEVAKRLSTFYNDLTFMSNDTMCRIRARTLGLTVSDFKYVDKTNFEFTIHQHVDLDTFKCLHGAHITEVNPEHSNENFNYIFTADGTEQVKLATISNGIINILGKDTERDLRRQDINPVNREQLLLSKAIQDDAVDIVVCEALAGSGKTLISMSNAIKLVRQKKYKGIIYFRASVDDVDDVEAVGYLSGNEEKFAVYSGPLDDTLDTIARNRNKASKLKAEDYELKIAEVVEEIREKCNIEFMTGLGMRGRTFDDVVFIMDEAQGQTAASFQKTVTRIGKNCKLIILGSNRQIDNKYLTKFTNGLSKVMNDCTVISDKVAKHAVTLVKVERGGIAEWGENLFTKKD